MDTYHVTSITTPGYDGEVPNSFWLNGSDTLLVLLPGLGYTNQMPLMFYLRELGVVRGWDLLEIDYDYRRVPRETTSEQWTARFVADVEPVIRAAVTRGGYGKLVLAGKSIGTSVMTSILNHGIEAATAYIWLTPLLRNPHVNESVRTHHPSIAVFGDADYAVQDVDLAPLAQAGVKMVIAPGADHGMMIPGNVAESIANIARAMQELDVWLEQNVVAIGENA